MTTPDEDREIPEYITVKQAGEILEVSKVKMAQLIREGVLTTHDSVLDKRVKLLKRDEVLHLAETLRPQKKLMPAA